MCSETPLLFPAMSQPYFYLSIEHIQRNVANIQAFYLLNPLFLIAFLKNVIVKAYLLESLHLFVLDFLKNSLLTLIILLLMKLALVVLCVRLFSSLLNLAAQLSLTKHVCEKKLFF